jgi:uncharacterized protein
MQINYQSVIDHFYKEDDALRHILLVHSRQVAGKALQIALRHPELQLDTDFLETAAMLHDIGIVRCDAPGIQCFGTEPYICHGRIGAEMLRNLLGQEAESIARVCERHTGAGLTEKDIVSQDLPLPHQDFLPETIAEQVICYADKFYSKSHLEREKTVEQAARSLAKFGSEGVERFRKWAQMFE